MGRRLRTQGRSHSDEVVSQTSLFDIRAVDLFAGGGGASEGIKWATGKAPLVAINHDQASLLMHAKNHPGTLHLCKSIYDVDPFLPHGMPLDLLWASPDCTHFSRAKGGKPRSKEIRGLAWVIVKWAKAVRPRVIAMENVPEFLTWGPLDDDGRPIKEQSGETFDKFVAELVALGYRVEWRTLIAADYGAPTTRKRLFLVARCDGRPVVWPEPTHGPDRGLPYRTAAESIQWDIPCPSIFTRKRPLAEKTLARIAEGLKRYVVETDEPFLLNRDGDTLVPYGIQTRNGERKGQKPRTLNLSRPLNTITAQGSQGALVAAFLAKHYTGVIGHGLRRPLGTVTAKDHHALVAAFLVKYYGTGGQLQSLFGPMHTVVSKARFGLVTVDIAGEEYAVVDIGMRMLQPRELARAQGFEDTYHLTGTKTSQIARIGNSVPPPVVRAIVAAQFDYRAWPAVTYAAA